mgnify:CR=1 FL=1
MIYFRCKSLKGFVCLRRILFFCYFTEYMWIHIVIENSDPCKDWDLFPFLIAVYEPNPGLILFWRVNREAFDYVVALHDWYRWIHLHWGNFHKFPTVTFVIFGVCDFVNKSPQDGTSKILKCLISIKTYPLHLADCNTMRSIFKISTVNSTTGIYPYADNCLEEMAFGKFVQLGWTNNYWF